MGEIIAAQLDRQWAGKLSLHGVMLSTFNSPCLPNVGVITAFKLLEIISMHFKTVIVFLSVCNFLGKIKVLKTYIKIMVHGVTRQRLANYI